MNDNCIFCKIGSGDIPSKTIYEDEIFRVILDVNPATRGHVLILPKEHYNNLMELDDETAKKAILLAKKIGNHMLKKLNCDGFNLVQNNGLAAGQTVFHFHLHIIPRYRDEKELIVAWKTLSVTEEALADLCSLLHL